jgi:hypothetical protein
MTRMKIAQADLMDMPRDKRAEVLAWLRSLDVDLKSVTPKLMIEHNEQGYRLHLSKYVRNEAGRIIIDHAASRAVTEPLLVDLGSERCWPEWLRAWSLREPAEGGLMICHSCRDRHHVLCKGGTWCYCQHRDTRRAAVLGGPYEPGSGQISGAHPNGHGHVEAGPSL